MTTKNPTGFCPRCNQQVLLKRKEFDTCLAIVLLLFTGIGFFIYLGVYYSRKENRCVHCGTEIDISQTRDSYVFQPQMKTQSREIAMQGSLSEKIKGELPNYCALCGEKLEVGIKFCPNCGSNIAED